MLPDAAAPLQRRCMQHARAAACASPRASIERIALGFFQPA